jgi:hypothetical protein
MNHPSGGRSKRRRLSHSLGYKLKTKNNQKNIMNQIQNSTATPAEGAKLLSYLAVVYPKKAVAAFNAFRADYERLSAELERWTPQAAAEAHRQVIERAKSDPSPANIAEVASVSRSELAHRYESASADLSTVRSEVMKRAAPVVRELRDVALEAITAEMARIEDESRERHEKRGAAYDPAADPLLASVSRFRGNVETALAGVTGYRSPSGVTRLLGEVAAK